MNRFAGVINFFSVQDWALEARLLRWLTMLWLTIGLVVLFSASFPVADAEVGDGARYFKVQILWIFVGLLMSRWITRHPLRLIMQFSGLGLFVCLGLIIATHIPSMGVTVNGATRWLPLGPFLIQPSELLKPFLILQSARLFGQWHRFRVSTRWLWLGVFAICLIAILIQPNLSTTAVCGFTLWLIAWASGRPYKHLFITAGAGALAAVMSISIKAYQRERIISFLDPWAQASDNGYQLVQSLYAIGSGGLWGTGFGMGQQKLGYLPIQYTDFIFSVYAEEFGFVGAVMLLLFLAVFSTVALLVALKAKSSVNRLIAIGCMVLLVGQSLINIGVATGSLPTTGLPFPMMSYGGSSMMSSLIIAGLLIRVAREAHEADIVAMTEQPMRPRRHRPGSRRRRHEQPQQEATAAEHTPAQKKRVRRHTRTGIRPEVTLEPKLSRKPSRKRKRIQSL
ncbi:cell cycle protein [Leptolyngbya sp. Heron Island J]|nr:cell cycle protein [Leptolyngbya sp. Heron Island J]